MHGTFGVNPITQLSLKRRFCLRQNSALRRFLSGQFGERRELSLEVCCGNSIPQSVLKCEDVHLLLLDPQNCRTRKSDQNLVRPQVDGEIMLQIETGFCREGPVQ